MDRASQKFDRQLFTLKLAELSRQIHIKSVASDRKAHVASRERGNSLLMHMVGGQLALLRDEWLTGIDRIAREVWQTQGDAMTPDFVREILVPEAMMIIRTKESQIKRGVTPPAPLTRVENPYPAQRRLAMEIRKLTGEVANRYEIEARELEYQKAPAAHRGPERQLEELGSIRGLIEDALRDTVLWLQANPSAEERAHVLGMQDRIADLDRIIARRVEGRSSPKDGWQWSETAGEVLSRLEKARNVRGNIVGKGLARLSDHLPPELPGSQVRKLFSPITPVRGSGMAPYPAKATQIPPDFLPYFPNGLIARTVVILTEAVRKFPLQTQALELCKYAISEMTPLFREAVETGTLRTDQVFFDSGMGGLLHSLLVYNCDHDGGRVRLGQEARKSDEWLRLAVEVAEASAGQAKQETSPSTKLETAKQLDLGGRPRKDDERKKVAELRSQGKTWAQIAIEMNRETDQKKSKDAYRNLLRSGKLRPLPAVQNPAQN